MKTNFLTLLFAGCFALVVAPNSMAANLLSPNDFIISIDTDPLGSFSASPDQEIADFAGDGDVFTKYLNFGKLNTGLIVEPFSGPTTIQSMVLATANDAVERDPTSYKIYGTNDAITSVNHGTGDSENWSLIAEGDLNLTDDRDTYQTPISFSNSTAYSAYRVLFPTVKDEAAANSMQIAEVGLFESNDGSGTSVWNDFDFPLAFQLPVPTGRYNGGEGPANILDGSGGTGISESASPEAESADKVVDGSVAKYLNFGRENSGFIAVLNAGPKTLRSFKFFTPNDFEARDPASYEVYGTNEFVQSGEHSLGTAENWTLISSGALNFTSDRDTFTEVTSITNDTAYNAYKMIFPTVKDAANANSLQFGEAFFYENSTGSGADFLSPADTVYAIDQDEFTGLQTKFLNLGGENGGFIVTPSNGATIVDSFEIGTANDFPERDPATWELWGTNDSITSEDTEQGNEENWTLIDSGTFSDDEVSPDRFTVGATVSVNNSESYTSYRMIFPTIRDNTEQTAVQLSHIQFFGDIIQLPGDFDGDGDRDFGDLLAWQRGESPTPGSSQDLATLMSNIDNVAAFEAAANAIPEPTSLALVVVTVFGLAINVRRRDTWGSVSLR